MVKNKISIIIPVYNVELYLGQCIESCLAQTYKNIEVIAIDDGSQDRSATILNDYAQKDSRLKVFNQPNGGTALARNNGISHSTGEWIIFVDSDDFLLPNAVELLYAAIQENGVQVVSGVLLIIRRNKIVRPFNNVLPLNANKETIASAILSDLIPKSLCGKIFSKNLFTNVEMISGLKIGEDAYVTFQLCEMAEKVKTIDVPVYGYVQRSHSTMHRPGKVANDSLLCFIQKTIDYYQSKDYFSSVCFQNNLAFFVMGTLSSYLRMGGHYSSIDEDLKIRLNQNYLNNKKACRMLAHWELLMLKAYKFFPLLGRFISTSINRLYLLKYHFLKT